MVQIRSSKGGTLLDGDLLFSAAIEAIDGGAASLREMLDAMEITPETYTTEINPFQLRLTFDRLSQRESRNLPATPDQILRWGRRTEGKLFSPSLSETMACLGSEDPLYLAHHVQRDLYGR